MSFLTGTQVEQIAAIGQASTALATFTAEDNLQKTYPAIILPPGFFSGGGSKQKSLRVKASGKISTFTSGTFTVSARLLTSTTWSAGGLLLGATPAMVMTVSITNAMWYLDLEAILRTEAIGAASTIVTNGEFRCPAAVASPFAATIPGTGVTTNVIATLDPSVQYYLFLSAACSVSNAANAINTEMLKVYGEN